MFDESCSHLLLLIFIGERAYSQAPMAGGRCCGTVAFFPRVLPQTRELQISLPAPLAVQPRRSPTEQADGLTEAASIPVDLLNEQRALWDLLNRRGVCVDMHVLLQVLAIMISADQYSFVDPGAVSTLQSFIIS